jgi:hypothetical protein
MAQRRNEVIPAHVIAASALTNDDFDRALEGFARFRRKGRPRAIAPLELSWDRAGSWSRKDPSRIKFNLNRWDLPQQRPARADSCDRRKPLFSFCH